MDILRPGTSTALYSSQDKHRKASLPSYDVKLQPVIAPSATTAGSGSEPRAGVGGTAEGQQSMAFRVGRFHRALPVVQNKTFGYVCPSEGVVR